ncbi:head GIN domain-containing protein [Polyangium aurulentum]|uniref:head GIN domain-containing protein n=1 Tax=Polyangium aurulentum TaxID=2567896 RepID=UPI0010AE4706|nr:head GIN domain-containing protein [Polyangium aurulentum]UQA59905.1 DUF2807 domain-containing protein [Polyangium aurulentum]
MNSGFIFALTMAATLTSSAWAESAVRGNGVSTEARRSVREFDQIQASGPYQLDISRGSRESVTIRGDRNIVPLVRTRQEGKTLFISVSQPIEPRIPLVVSLSVPELSAVSLTGAVEANLDAFSGRELRLEVGGACSLRAKNLRFSRLSADVTGASSLELGGHAAQAHLRIVGSSRFDGASLTSRGASLEVIGASSASLGASGNLTGRVVGASTVHYGGTPASAAGLAVDFTSFLEALPSR